MNLSNTVDVLNSAMKAGGKLLGQSGNLSLGGSRYGKIASDILNQAFDKGPEFLDKLSDKLSSSGARNALGAGNLPALGIQSSTTADETSVSKAMDLVRDWDKNQDGVLSRSELQQGIWDLDEKIKAQKGRAGGGDTYEAAKLNEYSQIQALGQKLLDQYDAQSRWDNQAGISVSDIKLMAFQDSKPYTISNKELALGAYQQSI
ncbi:MAG: hypothetical protein VKJ04_10200 [Vampirovibrionales bacterium]|nr:hypothetical protein [Vampirovibrionales bacterium]